MADGNGDNYTGGVNYWDALGSAPGALNADVLNDPNSGMASWWERNTPSPETLQQINAMRGALGTLKPLPDTGSGIPARPAIPPASMHPGQGGGDALGQYLQMLQQRQQQLRTQFLPKTAGLLGG